MKPEKIIEVNLYHKKLEVLQKKVHVNQKIGKEDIRYMKYCINKHNLCKQNKAFLGIKERVKS